MYVNVCVRAQRAEENLGAVRCQNVLSPRALCQNVNEAPTRAPCQNRSPSKTACQNGGEARAPTTPLCRTPTNTRHHTGRHTHVSFRVHVCIASCALNRSSARSPRSRLRTIQPSNSPIPHPACALSTYCRLVLRLLRRVNRSPPPVCARKLARPTQWAEESCSMSRAAPQLTRRWPRERRHRR